MNTITVVYVNGEISQHEVDFGAETILDMFDNNQNGNLIYIQDVNGNSSIINLNNVNRIDF